MLRRVLMVLCTLLLVPPALVASSTGATAATPSPSVLSTSGDAADIPTLSWSRVPEATSYEVQVATIDTFATTVWSSSTVNLNAVPTKQLPSGDLWFRVRANGPGGFSEWSTQKFTRNQTTGPTLRFPASGEQFDPPAEPVLLGWDPVSGATEYVVEISSDQGFTDPNLIKQYTTQTTRFVRQDPQAPRPYYWRVAAVLSPGITSGWSQTGSYVLGSLPRAELVSPADNATVTVDDVVLDWKAVPGARSYDVEISLVPDFTTLVHSQQQVLGTRYSPPTTLDNNQYYWRVRARDLMGNVQTWGPDDDPWTFRRAWPEQPILEYPANGSLVGDPFYFQWTPVKLASQYQLRVTDSVGVTRTCTTTQTTWTPRDQGLSNNDCWPQAAGTYSWRVLAFDDPKLVQTDPVNVRVGTFSYLPSLVQPTAPAPGTEVSIPTLRWTPRPGAAKYKVTVTNTATGAIPALITTTGTSFTPRAKLPEGTYRWWVQSVSEDGRLGPLVQPGDQWTFKVRPMETATASSPEPTLPAATYDRFPTLTWSPVSGASHYKLLVRRAGDIGDTVLAPTFAYPAGEDETERFLRAGDYEWRVEAWNGPVYLSTSTTPGRFTVAPRVAVTGHRLSLTGLDTGEPEKSCALTIPDSCEGVRNTPVLRWDPEPNTGYYELYLSYDRELTNLVGKNDGFPIKFPIKVANTLYTPHVSLPEGDAGTAYFWGVRPCTAAGSCRDLEYPNHSFSKLSNRVRPLSPGVPLAGSAPEDVPSLPDDITFTWDDYLATNTAASPVGSSLTSPARTEARQYRIQVSDDPQFSNLLDNQLVDQTTFTSFGNTYPDTQLYWRVQAIDGSNNPLPWSPTWTFDKQSPVPQLIGPSSAAGDRFDGSEPLTWKPLPYAAAYDVEIYRNNDTKPDATNRVDSGTVAQTAVSWGKPVSPSATPYTWRVRRVDAKLRRGDWSQWMSYTVATAPVDLQGPADGSRVPPKESVFSWLPHREATSYRWERRPAGGSAITGATTPATAYAPTTVLPDGEWEWRVVAVDALNKDLAASGWRSFSVSGTPVATAGVQIVGTGQVGSVLTSSGPQWDREGVVNSYQWLRNGVAIPGAIDTSYEVTGDDVARTISLRVTGALPGYNNGSTTSNGITGVAGPAPTTATPPSITGSGKVGTELEASPPTWNETDVAMEFQWLRSGTAISGQTGTSYTVTSADLDKAITFRVTGRKAGYAAAVVASNVINGVAGDAPVNTTVPAITGSAVVGQMLQASSGAWSGTQLTYTYQWFRSGAAIPGATAPGYRVAVADAGAPLAVSVTARRTGYADGTARSAEVDVARIASQTTGTLSDSKIRRRTRAKMNVRVTATGVSAPTGTVKVLKGTQAIASGSLSTTSAGRVTITLPRLPVGRHRLRVKYFGSTQVAGSTSAATTLRVVR